MAEFGLHRIDWKLPRNVMAFVTTRHGGVSTGDFESLNLASHVGDMHSRVLDNREKLLEALREQCADSALRLQWVQQTHGTTVHEVDDSMIGEEPMADAIYCRYSRIVCGVLTADCLPVLFSDEAGTEIAVAHAGWRGLSAGILEATASRFKERRERMRCWLGPAIAQCHFEVGADVRAAFLSAARSVDHKATEGAFLPGQNQAKWKADLYTLAKIRLNALGITKIAGESHCTVCHAGDFYSHRFRSPTGRFATLIVRTA